MKNAITFIVAAIISLGYIPDSSFGTQETNTMDNPYRRLAGDSEQVSRSGWVPEARQWEAATPVRDETKYQQSLREAYDGNLVYSPYEALAFSDENSSQVKTTKTPKGELDFTPDYIKKQGNENKNYVVMISANWCTWCKRMYPMIQELRKEGYIIYVFETNREEFRNYAALYNVKAYPTFIVYDGGKEVTRTVGKTDKDWFTGRLKTAEEQKPVPDPEPVNPYNGL